MILLMTTAPPENSAWYHGKRLPPIGLMYVAAALEKAGFEVQMLDNYLMKKTSRKSNNTSHKLTLKLWA